MNSKWYLGALLIVLAFLGVGVEQTSTPNQEIIVQFDSEEVTLAEAQGAIALVKEQLQAVGAENIQVRESVDGRLKITYYSQVDVANIKKILSHGETLELGYTSYGSDNGASDYPTEYDVYSYKLNVSEIQHNPDIASDFDGYVLEMELKTGNRRYIDADLHYDFTQVREYEFTRIETIAYQVQTKNALSVDNDSYNVPEVRAGPLS